MAGYRSVRREPVCAEGNVKVLATDLGWQVLVRFDDAEGGPQWVQVARRRTFASALDVAKRWGW